MGKIAKVITVIAGLGVVIIVGLSVALKYYLTDERVKGIVVPQAEKVLERKVSIGAIEVGLFSGITIRDFAIKERDGISDFVHAGAFVVEYDLLPLLKKEFVVSEIRLESPKVNVHRDKQGNFNFSTLKVLEKEKEVQESAGASKAVALPVALSVDTIRVVDAKLVVRDDKKELPDTDVSANLTVAVKIGSDLASLDYNGTLDLVVDAIYGELKPHAKVKATFDKATVNYVVDAEIAEEKVRLQGEADYSKGPQISLNITSQQLNLDYLAALGAALPQNDTSKKGDDPKKVSADAVKAPIADSLPPGLVAHGKIQIEKTLYKKLVINDFQVVYSLEKGVFTVSDLKADTAGGSISSKAEVDLNVPNLAYRGNLSAKSLDLTALGNGLGQSFAEIITGQLETNLNFDGAGIEPEAIKKALTAQADYSLMNGLVQKSALTEKISTVLGLPELETISFKDMTGQLKLLKGGKLNLDTSLQSGEFSAKTGGTMGSDGNLNMPVTLSISKTMMQRIDKGGSVSRFLANDKGETIVKLKVDGSYNKPKVSLDSSAMKKQVERAVTNRALQEAEKALLKSGNGDKKLPDVAEPVRNLLKGLFGN